MASNKYSLKIYLMKNLFDIISINTVLYIVSETQGTLTGTVIEL
jgi:hypothetical protein